jgi:RNA polymerase sigma-70 factor (ECF subfamily)
MDEDFLLIQKIKGGNEVAMDSFVRKYYLFILRYCKYHVIDKNLAEDLTQETFIKFFKGIPGYTHRGKAINYLYVIARNICIDYGKQPYEVPLSEVFKSEKEQLNCVETKIVIEQALCKLSDEMKEVVVLHYFQGLTLKETATILGIGLPLVKYRIKKAKEQLKELLRKEEFT